MTQKTSVFTRTLALILVLLSVVNIPLSAIAATESSPVDSIEPLVVPPTDSLSNMLSSDIFQSLLYLGYDADGFLRSEGLIFQKDYVGKALQNNYPNALTGIPYSTKGYGTKTTVKNGKTVPDVDYFRKNGLVCTSFVEYYYLNYLRNMTDLDVEFLVDAYAEALDRCINGTYKYGLEVWMELSETLVANDQGIAYRFTTEDSVNQTEEYLKVFDELSIGALIRYGYPDYGEYNDDFRHFGIYAGTYGGNHYIIHVGNSRGPEVTILEYMASASDSKRSYPIAIYDFWGEEEYGSITIKKEGPNSEALAGATFIVEYPDGSLESMTTDGDGKASLGELPLGTYTITEVEAPPGYVKSDKTWTITLTKDDPTGGGTLTVVNEPNVGSLQILKEITPSSAAIPENLAGWQFKLYHNSPIKTSSLNSSSANRSYRVTVTDKYGNSVSSAAGHMAIGPVITKQPTDQFTANGSNFTFSVTATNAASYQWEYSSNSGKTWSNWTSSASTSSTFTRAMSDTMRKYQFRCKITDSSGHVVYSDAVTPYHNTEFAITTQPQSQVSKVGSSASFTVGLSGSTSGATYQWQTSSNGGSSWSNVSTSATYTANKTSTSLLKVRCTVTVNGVSKTSDVADWVRADYKDASGDPAIYIAEAPKDYVGKSGSTASFEVLAAGEGLVYQWEYKLDDAETWVPVEKAYSDDVYETDTSGKTKLIQNIPVGSYYIKELTVSGKENWDYDFPKAIEITTGTTVYVTFTNEQHTGGLKIQKSTEDGKNLANWEFAIYQDKACTKLLKGGLFTGSAGTIIVDGLEPGMTVWVKEVGHKDSAIGNLYKVQGDNPKSAVISSDEIVTIDTFENVLKYGSLEIQKKTNTGKNLTGWQVNVYKGSVATANRIPGSPFTITDANGILVIDNLEPGTYYVKEVNDGDEYWVCDTTARKVTVVAGETADPVVITNKQYGKLDIKKVMTDGSSPAGWQFNVYGPDGSLIDGSPFKTDSDGKAIGLNEKLLDPGEYTIEEILVSDSSYTVVGSQKKTVTVERGVTAEPVIFENTPKLGSLQIQKKTSTGTDLAGWQFQVFKNITVKAPYNTNSTTNRSYRVKITDANGNVTYSDAVTMKAGAEITKQPVSQAVAAGSSTTFSVTAKGTDLKYQWQWKSPSQSNWINSSTSTATTASLKINMTAATDGRQYRCQITDGSGNVVYSDVASVYLPSTLAILAQPENAVTAQGDKQTFTISASGSNLTYQWQTKNEGSSTWTNQSGQTKATYTAQKGSTPLVYVRCAVSDGTNTIYTEPVIWALPKYDGKEIIIVEQPQPYFTPIGNQARFEVVAAGKDLIYQWEYQVIGSSTWLSAEEKFTTKTYSTDSDGLTDVISGLPCGSYYIREVDTGLEDWIYDTEPKYVEITPENYETAQKVTVTNVKIITGITIHKTTSDGKNLEGWLFSIYSDEACTKPIVENLRTNANGLITKEDLPLGTVWVKEIGHELEEIEKQYYINSTNPQSTVIENGVPAYVEFENMLKSGSLQILKQTNTGKELAGWQFQIYKNVTARSPWNTANTTNRSYRVKITDANGNVTYSYAAHMGTGAEITKQPVSQAVAAGSSAAFSVTAKGTGLTYQWQWKYPNQSTWTNSTASGATTASLKFSMASPFDGRQFRCQITDGSGNVVYSDAASIYLPTTLAILDQPESIVCEQGTKSTFKVVASGSNVTYQWQTKNLGAASWSNQSGKTSSTYSATKGSTPVVYVRCAVSDGTNTIYTEPVIWALPDYEGDTIIVEQPRDYYCALSKQAHYEIVAIGNKLVYQWEYQADGTSSWINVDQLYSKTKYETDEDGKTDIISNMPTGSYYVKEIKSSSSQWICDLIPKRIDIDVDTLESIQYANFYNIKTTNITIQKVTEDNENLKGWIFEIYYDQACTNLCVGNLETDEDGYITVKNLKPGKYWIKEVGHTDAGIEDLYVAKTPIQEVNVVVDTTNSFLFENMLKYGSLVIQKETNTGKNLEGWTVNVYIGSVATENRVPGSPFKTDSDGRIIVNNLLPGKYIVKEYTGNIKAYWTGDDIPHEVVVEAGKTTDPVYINNVHHAKLNIKKVMADGKSPVGWQFNLYDPTGALVPGSPFKVDNADGTVSELKNKLLLPGEYTVEEIISDDDTYMVNQKRQTVTLEAGKTASVTFINTPKTGSVQIIKETNTGNDLAGWQFLIYQNNPFRNPYNSEKTTNRAYRVKITDANGNVVYSDAANMTAGIHISKQPEHQIAAAGSSAIFSVKASGTGLTYQWETLRPGASSWTILTAASAINSGSQTDTYTLASMSESMDGRIYRCKITDSNGNSVYSEQVYLHLPSTFAILEYPKDSVCAQGSKTKFSVLVSGDNVTYQWQTRNENSTTWVNQPNQTKSTYTTSVKGSMPLVYVRCLIYNNGVLVEESQNHTAKWVLPEYNGKDILILEQPKDYTGPLNKNARFDVVAVGKDLIYEWEYKVSGSTSWLPSETLYTGDVELITDQYGKTPTLSGIPCGEYYIKEVNDGKENWIYDTSVRFLKVTPNNYTTMQTPGSFFNTHYGIGKIVKNTNTGENREGWIFEITDEDGNPVKDAFGNPIGLQTTDEKGMISLNLLPGTYLVKEVGPENDKWQLDKSTKALVVEAGKIKTVSFLNIMYGSLDIVKKTTNGGTLVGWTFLIEDENNEVIGQYTTTAEDIITDANGENVAKISISILPGTYYITEIANDDAYWTVDKSIIVVDVESDATATATFTNKWYGTGEIIKTMDDGSSPEGWAFIVTDAQGNPLEGSPFTTDENGHISLGKLEPGMYTVYEVLAPDSPYTVEGENPKTLEVKAGEPTTFYFKNILKTGSLQVIKTTNTGENLAGWQFKVYRNLPYTTPMLDSESENTVYRVVITDSHGNRVESNTVSMKEGPYISDQPNNLSVKVGSQGSFSVIAEGENLTYQWQWTNDDGITWNDSDWEGANTATVTFTMSGSFSGRQFRCIVTDENGRNTESAAATLYSATTLGILEQPDNEVSSVGATGIFSVKASGSDLTYQWMASNDNGHTWSNVGTMSTYSAAKTETPVVLLKCVVSDGISTIESDTVMWVRSDYKDADGNPGILIVDEPVNYTGPMNEKGRFQITAAGENLIYQWEASADNGTTWTPYDTEYIPGKILTTDETGKTEVLSGVPCGSYYIKEYNIDQANWICDTSAKYVLLPTTDTVTIQTAAFHNIHYGQGWIIKETTNGGTRAGWIFEITDANGNPVKDAFGNPIGQQITDETGIIVLNLLPGTYLVKEVGPENDGYWIMDTEIKTLAIKGGETDSVTFLNKWLGKGQIVKETTNGGTLIGWIFEVRDAQGNLVGTYTTTADHIVGDKAIITIDLEPGNYTVKEIGPENDGYWVMDTDEKVLTVESGKTSSVSFLNQWLGKGQIVKTTTNGGTLIGWIFEVRDAQGNLVGTYTTTADHIVGDKAIITIDLEPGNYTVKEVGPQNDGFWILDSEAKALTVEAGKIKDVSFRNQWFGKGQIIKDTTNGGTKAGWIFEITDTNGNPVKDAFGNEIGLLTSDETGIIVLNLLPGTYLVKEVGPENDGYWIMDTEIKTLIVTAGNTASVSFLNKWLGKGQIVKETTNGGTLIGWIFEVRDAQGDLVGTYTTSAANIADGKAVITIDLEPGVYTVKEIGPVKDDYWTLDSSVKTLVVEAGQTTATDPFLNQWKGKGQIIKETTNGGTLVGWIFEIKDLDGNLIGTYTTTADNIVDGKAIITMDLEPGTYYIREIGPDMGEYWIMDDSVKTLIVEAGKTTAAEPFTNQWIGKAEIYKVMTDGSSPAGWQFKVIGPDGKEIPGSPFTTDENGYILIDNLQPGDYIIEEIIPEDCLYRPVGENPVTVTVVVGDTVPVTFENELRPGKILVEKINETGERLPGAKFLLEWSLDGSIWTPVSYNTSIVVGGCSTDLLADGTLITGESGIIEFTNLHPALQYRVTEVEAPNGYVLQTESVFIGHLPTEDLTVSLLVKNDHVFIMPSTGVPAGFNTALKASFTAVFAAFMIAGAAIVSPRMVSVHNPDEKHKK